MVDRTLKSNYYYYYCLFCFCLFRFRFYAKEIEYSLLTKLRVITFEILPSGVCIFKEEEEEEEEEEEKKKQKERKKERKKESIRDINI